MELSLKSVKVLSDQNEIGLPSKEHLSFFLDKDYYPTLYLDANICLFFLNYFNGSIIREEIKNDILVLVEYFQTNKISILPDYGILELVYNKNTFVFDKNKYDEIIEKVLYSFQLPIEFHKKQFKKGLFKVSYPPNYTSYTKINKWGGYYFVSYTTLLKVYLIAKKTNPSKTTVIKNLKELLKWCDEVLDTSMGLEIFLALKIFGGYSNFKKMIDLDGRKGSQNIFNTIKGTVWDLIHIRLVQEGLIKESMKSFLVTDDRNLSSLFATINLQSVSELENGAFINYLTDISEPIYSDDKIKREVDEILKAFFEMRQMKIIPDAPRTHISKLYPITRDLEQEIENNA